MVKEFSIFDSEGREKKRNKVEEIMEDMKVRDIQSKANQLESMALDRQLAEEKIRLQELQVRSREFQDPLQDRRGLTNTGIDPAIIKMIFDAPPEQRAELTSIALSFTNGNNRTGNEAVIALMSGFLKQNPQSSKNETYEVAKILNDNMKTFLTVMASQNQKQADPIQTVASLFQLMQSQQPKEGMFDKLFTDAGVFERLKTIFTGNEQRTPSGGDPHILLEIEKLRSERELSIKKMDREDQRWTIEKQLEAESEKAKYDLIQGALSGPLGKTLQALGGAGASKIAGVPIQPQQEQTKSNVAEAQCPKCSKRFYAPLEAKSVICPGCGVTLTQTPTGGETQSATATTQSTANPTPPPS